jgi:hypothetical protein
MKLFQLVSLALVAAFCTNDAAAQFSIGGPGSTIPAAGTGGGGVFPGTLPPSPAMSTVNVPGVVSNLDSIVITNLNHTYLYDLTATIKDPNGNEHLLWVRPGGSADFTGNGIYTFVELGAQNMPTSSDIPPGTYNQSFSNYTGTAWVSGDSNIFNTPLGAITGPAGIWTLSIYDWAGADVGSFSSWTLNGNGGGAAGLPYCFGDGTGVICPCFAFGAQGSGCVNSSGAGATLTGTGAASIGFDTFALTVTGAPPNKPGIFFQGTSQLNNPINDGILCTNMTLSYGVNFTSPGGDATRSNLAATASAGTTLNYQYWYRDPSNSCGGGSNYSNGWTVTWQ